MKSYGVIEFDYHPSFLKCEKFSSPQLKKLFKYFPHKYLLDMFIDIRY